MFHTIHAIFIHHHLIHRVTDLGFACTDLADASTHIFICGSANMAEDCKTVLRETSPLDYADVVAEGRIHCEVFGALSAKV